MKHNTKVIPNTSITVKEFKELIYDKFKAYPMMYMNYRKNQFEIVDTFYTSIYITQNKLSSFCKKLGINHEFGYHSFHPAIIIKLNNND
jgi:hypothetical protein